MAYYLYRDIDDDRVYAFDDPRPDLAARPNWMLEPDQTSPEAIAAINLWEADREQRELTAALVAQSYQDRLEQEKPGPHATAHQPGGSDPMAVNAAAGTGSLRTLGTAATAAAAGNHSHGGLTADQAAGTASVRTLGTGATQAAAGNHSHGGLMTGSAAAVADSVAADVAALLADHNALLAALRARGVIAGG